MSEAEVTILMVPRERYSGIAAAIQSLYEHTSDVPFKLVYVDGGLPGKVLERVQQDAAQRGFTFIHKDYPLTPNEARNIGLASTDTEYVVFCDNDILYTDGWLKTLIATAREFNAWLVGPTILDGDPEDGLIHAAGGDSGFEEVNGGLKYHFVPGHMQKNIRDVQGKLQRGPSTMLEFHVLLARRDVFDKIGPLDEKFCSFADHDDLVISVLKAGGPVIYEPGSVVAYHDPGTNMEVLEPEDLPPFLLRWSDEWNNASIDHAADKWRLDKGDPWVKHAKKWARLRRRRVYPRGGFFGRLTSFTIFKISESAGAPLEATFCKKRSGPLIALRQKNGRPH